MALKDRATSNHDDSTTNVKQTEPPPDKIGRLLDFACNGDVEEVEELLDAGLPVDSADYDGRTALHLAASEGRYGVIELLLKRNASVNPIDRWDDTPLADARRYNYTKICEILVANGGIVKANKCERIQCDTETSKFEIDPEELPPMDYMDNFEDKFVRVVNWRGTKVAAKVIRKTFARESETIKEFVKELSLLQRLRHPNIVQFLGAVTTVTKSNPLVIVTEYLPNGDLNEIMKKKVRIPSKQAVNYSLDIARNLLQDEAGHLKVQLADSWLSKLLKTGTDSAIDATCRNLYDFDDRYMAPEVRRNEVPDTSADVYSFGKIVHEMFEGPAASFPIREGRELAVVNDRVFSARAYPPKMKELLKNCWDEDPKCRPTFAQIILTLEAMLETMKRRKSRWTPKPMVSAVTNMSATWQRCLVRSRRALSGSIMSLDESMRGGFSHRKASNLPRVGDWPRGTTELSSFHSSHKP